MRILMFGTSLKIASFRAPIFFMRSCLAFGLCLLWSLSVFGGPIVAHHNMSSGDYQQKFNEYSGQGYRLTLVDGYEAGSKIYYAAIWEKTSGPAYKAHHGMSAADYQQKFNDYDKQGYKVVLVDGCGSGNQAIYAAIWEKKDGPAYATHHGMTGAGYQQKFNEYDGKGYRLLWVSGYGVGNQAYYAAIWEKSNGPAYKTHHGMSSADYQNKFNQYTEQGYRLKQVCGYNVGDTDYYAAIWEKTGGNAWSARHRMSSLGYQNEFDNFAYSGYVLKHVSGYERGSKAQFAAIWESTGAWSSEDLRHIDKTIGDFMKQYNVPGASVGLVKDGRLVFAKGYGDMDKSTGDAPGPNTLFRLASVSKPITSVAMMRLMEQQGNGLKIDHKVLGSGAILGTAYGSQAYSDWEKEVTVQHLLEHTAGGNQWNNKSDGNAGDPMFQQTSSNHSELIGWVLDNRNPEKKPGTKSDYSNFGFCMLGRIIEKKTGQTYENYVKNSVLKPCGITNMHVAGDTKDDRRYNEAVYYSNDGGNPYGMKVKRMDAHGGWTASALDMMRFIVRVDGSNTKPDIISASSFTTMTTPCSVDNSYAKGWSISGNNYWHNGSISGTGAVLVRTGTGLSWIFLMNSTWEGAADGMMWDVVKGIKKWPAHDWF